MTMSNPVRLYANASREADVEAHEQKDYRQIFDSYPDLFSADSCHVISVVSHFTILIPPSYARGFELLR